MYGSGMDAGEENVLERLFLVLRRRSRRTVVRSYTGGIYEGMRDNHLVKTGEPPRDCGRGCAYIRCTQVNCSQHIPAGSREQFGWVGVNRPERPIRFMNALHQVVTQFAPDIIPGSCRNEGPEYLLLRDTTSQVAFTDAIDLP